ncbi:hypothetical protein D3C72_2481240 [compost metagenome]
MPEIVASQAHHDWQLPGLVQHGIQNGQLFRLIERGGFAGAAAHHQPRQAATAVMGH